MTEWPSNAPAVEPQAAPAFTIEQRDELISLWLKWKGELAATKELEASSRTAVTDMLFPNPKKGTQRYALNNGYAIKLVHGWNYTLGDKDKTHEGVKVSIKSQVEAVLDEIEQLGGEGRLLADRLVNWKPELSASEYEKLDLDDPVQAAAKHLIDRILTVKPASPQLAFEEPKVK